MTFTTPNVVRGGSYALIHVPDKQASVEERYLKCRDLVAGRLRDCEIYEEQDDYTIVKMDDLCQKGTQRLCSDGEELNLLLQLSNSNSLSSNFLPTSFMIELYTSDHELIERIDDGVFVTPELSGVDLSDIEAERKSNLVGGLDFLKFFIPSLDGTFTINTDMLIELPEDFAFFKRDEVPLC